MCVAVNGVSFTVGRGEHWSRCWAPRAAARPRRCAPSPAWSSRPAASSASTAQAMYRRRQRRNMPTEQRGVSMVFQSYAVWPHMTVFDNVAYGLRVRKQGAPRTSRPMSSARSTWCRCAISRTAPLPSFRAASSSGWRWRARSRSRRRWCCSTSRCPTSTPSCGLRCGSSCASCSGASASPRSMSRTTRRRRSPSPTG